FLAFEPSVGNHRSRQGGFPFVVAHWPGGRDLEPESRRNVRSISPVRSIVSPQVVTARIAAAVVPS
ncbi:unnamed protein product, partial [Ixodes hexagonus]